MKTYSPKAMAVLKQMQSPETFDALTKMERPKNMFAGMIGELAMDNVFDKLWTRDGLDLKTRSLITCAILIALRAEEEMAIHFPSAVRNGATIEEIEELLYHATGYAGFPAVHSARKTAERSLKAAGMID